MFDWTPSTVRRLVAAMALALAVLPFTSGGGFFHAVFNVYNAEAAADGTAFADHGRSHDDSSPDERQSGHLNEHNAADHSHEPPAPAVSLAWHDIRATRTWRRNTPDAARPASGIRIERPPRPDRFG